MGVSKRHHTVPKFYLNGFGSADNTPQLGAVRLSDAKRLVIPTTHATVRTNFYALPGHPEGADVFEKELSRMEGDASAIIRKAVTGTWPLPREDREILGTFLALQFRRGPDARMLMDQMYGKALSQVISQMGVDGVRATLAQSGKHVGDDVLDRLVQQASESEGLTMKTAPAEHILHILELVPRLVPYFIGRPWILIRFNRRKLLTCDTPVALVRDLKLDGVFTGVGVATAWGISLPLARDVGLLLGNPQPLFEEAAGQTALTELWDQIVAGGHDREMAGTTKMARLLNSHTIANARNWVFHHPDDAGLVPGEFPGPRDR
ncbi:DUF4238 domain-containing protein [Sinomonas mesophila]|uniref:DUF4238 domain-containing protein n=1 Tax=Sinomonas mesophila TaxID=1531955 RepID=UPI0009864EB1|nr:DUF4238 domain-containing protein [Sinomonas mesophila]